MRIQIHPHAAQRIRERGVTVRQVRETVANGSKAPAKFHRIRFRQVFPFNKVWNGRRYAKQQVEAFAATMPDGWLVVTVIVKYF